MECVTKFPVQLRLSSRYHCDSTWEKQAQGVVWIGTSVVNVWQAKTGSARSRSCRSGSMTQHYCLWTEETEYARKAGCPRHSTLRCIASAHARGRQLRWPQRFPYKSMVPVFIPLRLLAAFPPRNSCLLPAAIASHIRLNRPPSRSQHWATFGFRTDLNASASAASLRQALTAFGARNAAAKPAPRSP